jgi:hypothetical protein
MKWASVYVTIGSRTVAVCEDVTCVMTVATNCVSIGRHAADEGDYNFREAGFLVELSA